MTIPGIHQATEIKLSIERKKFFSGGDINQPTIREAIAIRIGITIHKVMLLNIEKVRSTRSRMLVVTVSHCVTFRGREVRRDITSHHIKEVLRIRVEFKGKAVQF